MRYDQMRQDEVKQNRKINYNIGKYRNSCMTSRTGEKLQKVYILVLKSEQEGSVKISGGQGRMYHPMGINVVPNKINFKYMHHVGTLRIAYHETCIDQMNHKINTCVKV